MSWLFLIISCNNSNFLENVKRRDIDQKPSPKSSSIVCFLLFFNFLFSIAGSDDTFVKAKHMV